MIQVIPIAERTFESFMAFDDALFEMGIDWPSRTTGRLMPNGSSMVGTNGKTKKLKPTRSAHDKHCSGKRCICRIKRTTKAAMDLLCRVDDQFEYSDIRGFGFFDNPMGARKLLNKAMRATRRKWVPLQPTRRKNLKRHMALAPRKQRSAYATRMLVRTKGSVTTMRAAVTNLYGQGFLRKAESVYPYRLCDSFAGGHRVNVYKRGNRFDVIDANCNLHIFADLTSRAQKGRAMVKRFLLFEFDYYYPAGGWSDFRGSFDTVQEAIDNRKQTDYVPTLTAKSFAQKKAFYFDNFQIVDVQTGEIVAGSGR